MCGRQEDKVTNGEDHVTGVVSSLISRVPLNQTKMVPGCHNSILEVLDEIIHLGAGGWLDDCHWHGGVSSMAEEEWGVP